MPNPKIIPNPLGVVIKVKEIDDHVQEMIAAWKADNPKTKFNQAVGYILQGVDELCQKIDPILQSGPDKKATVIAAIAILYEIIVAPALPIWLMPFSSAIENFILYVLVSSLIDFIVSKYHTKAWRYTQ